MSIVPLVLLNSTAPSIALLKVTKVPLIDFDSPALI